ncbi:DinB family protein [Arthrobacter sp. 35W]|uniref:DinB family protein n=1 Tax=Arthrobacter sp. 35W TaxID=1132441 RepID=UPI0003F9F320|nr:DinB family protein [Arthrobacter sp. 35W]
MSDDVSGKNSPEVPDTRVDPPFLAGERESLETWLELYRATLPIKVGGLAPEQLAEAAVPPSNLTLLGIVRHLSEVERYWFTAVVAGEPLTTLYSGDDPDGDFNDVDASEALADLERFHGEVAAARANAAAVGSLDDPLPGARHGRELNLRWVYVHMIEEYARHLGHADLLRECLDGTVGY